MNILHVYRTYFPDPPGGLQEAIRQICLSTAPDCHSTIFTLSPAPHPQVIEREETTVVRCRSWAAPASCDLGGLHAYATFRELSRKSDIIHYHFPWPFADLLRFFGDPRKPSVMTYHSDIVRQQLLARLYEPLMGITLRHMRAVIATSPVYAQTSPVLTQLVAPEKLHVIPLGIAEDTRATLPLEKLPLDASVMLPQNGFILALGVLRYYKGLHSLIEAAAYINAPIVIAGSGPQEAALKALAKERGAHNVYFFGQVSSDQKFALLRRCRALALPSHLRSEAFGMVLVEAMMCGKPTVCCEIGSGTSYVNEHGITGFVVPPESPVLLAEALVCLLGDDKLAAQMGAAARERYKRLFSSPALGRSYNNLYRTL